MNSRPPLNPWRFVNRIPDSGTYHAKIAEIAYFFSERRGFEPGHELEDWLAAERA